MLITPQLKDALLRELVENYELGEFISISRNDSICEVKGGTLSAILSQFNNYGLISLEGTRDSYILKINIDAHDFLQKGGFYGYEELFKNNVEKLLLEVEKLQQKNTLDNLTKITEIATGLLTFYGIIKN